ncbi:MAG TPA: hypothetical protein V6C65_26900 [Allocoleopsis sp.]
MVQQFIDYGIEFIFWAFAAHTVLYFTAGLMARRRVSPGQLSIDFDRLIQCQSEAEADDGQWLDEVKPIALPDGIFSCDADSSDAALVEQFSQFIADYWQRRHAIDVIVPFVRPVKRQQQAIDLSSLGIRELRKLYSQRGLSGLKLSHATKGQLLAALAVA